jgi:hypothetical protein
MTISESQATPAPVKPGQIRTGSELRIPTKAEIRQGVYSDGKPLDDIQYFQGKLILKPDRFTSAKVFLEFGKLVGKAAKATGVRFNTSGVILKPIFREVVFGDTADFRLYNNAFILRRRITYENGFPVGEPEVVFKFRHTDIQKAAETDVRPKIAGNFRIKFKTEALPLKDQIGGYRRLFSHNTQFPLSQMPEGDRLSMSYLAELFPALAFLKQSAGDRIELVNQTIVEEVLQDLGFLDFGGGAVANANVAIWRERGSHKPLCGEFAFQAKFKSRDEIHDKQIQRCHNFFIALQQETRDWLSLGSTKTGLVYRLKGNPPNAHE